MSIQRRIEKLEEGDEQAQPGPSPVRIYNASIPGDAERKAAEAHAEGVTVVLLIPDNGRPPQDESVK